MDIFAGTYYTTNTLASATYPTRAQGCSAISGLQDDIQLVTDTAKQYQTELVSWYQGDLFLDVGE